MELIVCDPVLQFGMDGSGYLTLKVDAESKGAARTVVNELSGHKLTATIDRWREKRSLSANAYAWVLMGKLAAVLRQSKIEVYRHFIRDIGGNYEIVPVRNDAVETWRKNWQSNGDGWVCDILAPAKTSGYTNVVCYYGSSTYDTTQMSVLIDAIIAECKEADIETLPPREIEKLKEHWHEKKDAASASV